MGTPRKSKCGFSLLFWDFNDFDVLWWPYQKKKKKKKKKKLSILTQNFTYTKMFTKSNKWKVSGN